MAFDISRLSARFSFGARAGLQPPGPDININPKETIMTSIQSGKLRGTRLLMNDEALAQRTMEAQFRSCLHRPWL